MKNLILFSISLLLIIACSRNLKEVKSTLQIAGENKKELKKVLEYYKKKPSDSLKYKAACFLIKNMQWHYSRKVILSDDFWNTFLIEDSLSKGMLNNSDCKSEWALKGYKYVAKKILIKSNIKKTTIEDVYTCDASLISSDILINTIETAFQAWGQVWNKNLSFDEFCEYILPYRFNSEPVFDIRLKLYDHFKNLQNNDTLRQNPIKTTAAINQYINNFYWDWFDLDIKLPDLGFYNIFYWNINDMHCFNHVAIQGQILRSVGIPVAEVFTSKWNDSNTGHSWLGIWSYKNAISLFSPIYQNPGNEEDRFRIDLATKFFIRTFAAYENTPYFLKSDKESLPSVFSTPCFKDITGTLVKTSDIELSIPNPPKSNNIAYFCSFINGSWDPIAWGGINHQKQTVKFKQIPLGLIGLPCLYDGKSMFPNGSLVKVNVNGNCTSICPDKSRCSLTLYRKFPYKARMQYFAGKIIGTAIEGANKADFSDAVKLSTIKDTLMPYLQDYFFKNEHAYRYYRLISPEYNLYIAELEFLTEKKQSGITEAQLLPIFNLDRKQQKIFYKVIGSMVSANSDNKAFDGKMLTFTDAKWVGIDFGTPKRITQIRVAPRNSNNGIVLGDNYELYFWDGKWIFTGEQQAKHNFLQFHNVPQNTYYWLRNVSNGREEQPFLYEGGLQLFISNKFPFNP